MTTAKAVNRSKFHFNIPIEGQVAQIKHQARHAFALQYNNAKRGERGMVLCELTATEGLVNLMTFRGTFLPKAVADRIRVILEEYERECRMREIEEIATSETVED